MACPWAALVDPPAAGYTLFQNFLKRSPPGHGPAFHARGECREELLTPSELARKTVDLASEKQASDILLLDLRSLQVFTDYFVILTAESRRQIDALREELVQALKEMGVTNLRQEGTSESGWVLLDFGDVVVHIFAPEERAFYQLEQLWSNARQVVRIQ